jgi:hypothetical protein
VYRAATRTEQRHLETWRYPRERTPPSSRQGKAGKIGWGVGDQEKKARLERACPLAARIGVQLVTGGCLSGME